MSQVEQFQGFDTPGTTATPDYVFDFLLDKLTGNELKVLMYIIRRTFGFGKNADAISLSQFSGGIKTKDGKVLNVGCGVKHNRLILIALHGLEKKGYVISQKREETDGSKDTTIYKLRFKKDAQVVTPSNEVVTSGNQGGSYFSPQGVVTSGNQQETHVEQETLDECVVSPTLEQPEITPTLSDADLIALCQQRGILPSESIGYENQQTPEQSDTQPPIEISTQQAANVDKSHENHSQGSYSHRPTTTPAQNVGRMGVLEVPIIQGIDEVVTPPSVQVKPQVPTKPVVQTPAPKLLHTPEAIAISKMYVQVAGPGGFGKWDWDAMEEMVQAHPTVEDIKLLYNHLKGKKRNMEAIWLNWFELATLKKKAPAPGQVTEERGVSGRPRLRAPETRRVVGGTQ